MWLNTWTRRKPSYKKGTSEQREHEAITLPLRLNRSRSFVITFFAGIKVGRLYWAHTVSLSFSHDYSIFDR